MRGRSNAGFFERLRGPSSTSYRGELQKRRAQARKDARERKHQERLEAQRDREAKKEEIRREREQIREANKLKRQLLKEEKAERKAEARQREQERADRAIPSAAAIERAYKRGAKTLGEAMDMARGNPASYRGMSSAKLEQMLIYANARAYDDDWMVRQQGRRDVEAIEHALKNARKREAKKGNPSEYQYSSGLRKPAAESLARRLKAEDSKLKRMGGTGNYQSIHVRPTFERPGGKEYGVFVVPNPAGSKGKFERCVKSVAARGGARDPRAVCGAMEKKLRAKKGNPADGAAEAYEIFHGRKPEEFVTIAKQRHYHKHLAAAGELERLVIETPDGRAKVTLSQFDGALLAFNDQALKELAKKGKVKLTQLFIEGGDQSVDLEDFGIDPDNVHEIETLGKAVKIDYFTTKDHLGGEGGTAVYGHKFRTTNEDGKHVTVRIAKYPDVIYRVRDNQLEFSGGSYEIRAEGIDK